MDTTWDPPWPDLLERIEADLERRSGSDAATLDPEAWAELTTRVRVYAERYGYMTGLGRETDDVVQDVLLRLQSLTTLRRVRAARSAPGYLITLIRRSMIDAHRRREVELAAMRRLDYEWLVSEGPSPPDEFADQLPARIRKELSRLSHQDQQFIEARYWHDQSIQSIADQHGMKYSAVAVRIFRVLHRLRKAAEPPDELAFPDT